MINIKIDNVKYLSEAYILKKLLQNKKNIYERYEVMKKILAILLTLVVVFGCEDKEKEHKDCDCAPQAEEMLDGGLDSESQDEGGQEEADEGLDAEQEDLGGDPDASEEEPCDDCDDCEDEDCEGEDCDC